MPDVNELNQQLNAWMHRVQGAANQTDDPALRKQLNDLLERIRESQVKLAPEVEKATKEFDQRLEAVKAKAEEARATAAAAAAAAPGVTVQPPSFDLTPPPPPPSPVDQAFGLRMRQELLERFGLRLPGPPPQLSDEREIWEDWD